MDTQFKAAQDPASTSGAVASAPSVASEGTRGPELLLRITPWHRVFFGNAIDLILFRRLEPVPTTSSPAEFWPDVFVSRKLPLGPFWQSALYHIFLVTVLWGFSQTWLMRPRTVPTRDPFQHQTITYYSVSEYLPPLESPSDPEPASKNQPGEPEYARQRIVSVPRNPDSHTQTIVAPPKLKLPADVSIPNIVAWTPTPAPVPLAAAAHSPQALVAPALPAVVEPAPSITRSASATRVDVHAAVVEPAPAVDNAKLRTPADLPITRAVVEPPPSIDAHVKSPNLPLASAVEAAPTMREVRRMGEINIAHADTAVTAAALPITEQVASGSLLQPRRQALSGASASGSAASSPPSLQMPGAGASGNQSVGQLIALGIRPAVPNGPIPIPQGSRTGTFSAGPEGKHGASGTPELKAASGSTANGSGNSSGRRGQASPIDGLTVAPGATRPNAGIVVAGTPKPQPAPNTFASMMRPKIADIARTTSPAASPSAAPRGKIEDEVFGGKKYYSMTLNMPNLVSASGSWIIRFAELNVGPVKGELTAPVAMQKVDPAYPTELMRQRVEGTVVLYAVIHADGTVADVRVLRGVDDRLDQNARLALMKWRFRPGTRNGSAVDLEAVVQIPFIARQLPY